MNPKWSVREVEPLSDYRLLLTFEDRQKKIFDVKRFLDYPLFEPLKNESFFKTVRAEACTAVWSDQIDIDPELLYAEGQSVDNNSASATC